MDGYFKKAPLLYVTATIRTSEIPGFGDNKFENELLEAMIVQGLPIKEDSRISTVKLQLNHDNTSTEKKDYPRRGFLSTDRQQCLVLSADGVIEYRDTNYHKFNRFLPRMMGLIEALCAVKPAYTNLAVHEILLNYSDTIVPHSGRTLQDYLKPTSLLPLNNIIAEDGGNDVQQSGMAAFNRVITPNLMLSVSMEQVPLSGGKVSQWLPKDLIEVDPRLSMPITIKGPTENADATHYGLLSTKGAHRINRSLKDAGIAGVLDLLHSKINGTFESLLNWEICRLDWEYVEEDR